MTPGRHAAEDGSFGRSAGIQAGRAVLLLSVAVVIGIVLLNTSSHTGQTVSAGTRTTVPPTPVTTLPPVTTTVPVRAPADVKVLPANGTSVNQAGSRLGTELQSAGYNVLAAVSATSSSVSSTTVYYQPGYDREAQILATSVLALSAGAVQPIPSPPPVSDTKGAAIVVLLGSDLAKPPPTSTPTTARTTATTAPRTTATTARTATTVAHSTTSTTKKP